MKRRTFLKLAGASVPALVWGPSLGIAAEGNHRMVLLVELKGGNDALNTFVPFQDEAYRRARPNLALAPGELVEFGGGLGLHPSLRPLESTIDAQNLAIIEGLGYANPNRSHFRSIEIWDTASDAEDYLDDGWVTRAWRKKSMNRGGVPAAIVAGNGEDGPLAGFDSLNLGNPTQTFRWGKSVARVEASSANPALAHVIAAQNDLVGSVASLEEGLEAVPDLRGFPNGSLGRQLALAARIFASGLPVSVVKVTLDGFDTHVQQSRRHANLLAQLGEGLARLESFARDAGFWDRLLVSTYSEFGRRVAENAGRGTDHGTASAHLMMGGGVCGGLYGARPSLTKLQGGDLVHTTDYRRLYATISRWWGSGAPFEGHEPLGVLAQG